MHIKAKWPKKEKNKTKQFSLSSGDKVLNQVVAETPKGLKRVTLIGFQIWSK